MKPLLLKVATLVAVFAVVTAIASIAGAKNLGTAMTFGQVAFGLTLLALMVTSARPAARDAADDTAG